MCGVQCMLLISTAVERAAIPKVSDISTTVKYHRIKEIASHVNRGHILNL
jgi:hypothetical protein